jgi:hypothetical protein
MIAYKLVFRNGDHLQSFAFHILPPELVQIYVPFEFHFAHFGKFLVYDTEENARNACYGISKEWLRHIELWECEVTGAESMAALPVPNIRLKHPIRPLRRFWQTRMKGVPAPTGTVGVESIRLIRKIGF